MKANGMGTGQDSNFTMSSAQAVTAVDVGVRDLMQLCLQENDRRFDGYDARLSRPKTVPALARLAVFLTRPWARSQGGAEPVETVGGRASSTRYKRSGAERGSDERSPAGG